MIDNVMIRRAAAALVFCLFLLGGVATATDMAAPDNESSVSWLPLGLESYEPSAFGYTKNNDDVHFENFKLSVQFPLMPKFTKSWWGDQDRIYFSFTGLFAFYIGDRHSGPVVGQEYNPQSFWKHLWSCKEAGSDKYVPNGFHKGSAAVVQSEGGLAAVSSDSSNAAPNKNQNCYFTISYNHDSNGQIIDSPGQFLETERQQGLAAAYDATSRGWDYIGVNSKFIPFWSDTSRVTVYPMLKYFLADGLLQGNPEELHYWEHPADAKPRRDVDGLTVLAKYQREVGPLDTKLAVGYTTGYEHAFRYNTARVEAGVLVMQIPIVFWTQDGYMSDLSRYYQRVRGYGVQIEIGSF